MYVNPNSRMQKMEIEVIGGGVCGLSLLSWNNCIVKYLRSSARYHRIAQPTFGLRNPLLTPWSLRFTIRSKAPNRTTAEPVITDAPAILQVLGRQQYRRLGLLHSKRRHFATL